MVNQTGIKSPQKNAESWLESPGGRLACFLAALVVICGVACLYVYQVSQISTLRAETVALQHAATSLEHQNAAMMVDLARLNGPGYIRTTALQRGMAPVAQAVYLVEPVAQVQSVRQQAEVESESWQTVLRNLSDRLFAGDSTRDVAQVGR